MRQHVPLYYRASHSENFDVLIPRPPNDPKQRYSVADGRQNTAADGHRWRPRTPRRSPPRDARRRTGRAARRWRRAGGCAGPAPSAGRRSGWCTARAAAAAHPPALPSRTRAFTGGGATGARKGVRQAPSARGAPLLRRRRHRPSLCACGTAPWCHSRRWTRHCCACGKGSGAGTPKPAEAAAPAPACTLA